MNRCSERSNYLCIQKTAMDADTKTPDGSPDSITFKFASLICNQDTFDPHCAILAYVSGTMPRKRFALAYSPVDMFPACMSEAWETARKT